MRPLALSRAWPGLLLFFLAALLVLAIGGAVTRPAIPDWYAALAKPSWTPPDWLFAPVWSALYAMMALAAFLVWRRRGAQTGAAIAAWWMQLALNLGWSILFFGLRWPAAALVEIAALWLAIALTMRLVAPIDRRAALLLLPYLVWVSYAVALNGAIVALN